MYNVRLTRSAEREAEDIPNGPEKELLLELFASLEDNPFPVNVIKLKSENAFAVQCGRFNVYYCVLLDDQLVVVAIKEEPDCTPGSDGREI